MNAKHYVRRKGLIPLVCLLLTLSTAGRAQSLYVMNNQQASSIFQLNELKQLSFKQGKLLITEQNGSTEIDLSDIRYLSFENYSETSTALEDNEESFSKSITCFPNPCTSSLNINTENFGDLIKIEILSSTGQLLTSYDSKSNNTALNVTGLNKGLYLLKVASDTETCVTSFIKQ